VVRTRGGEEEEEFFNHYKNDLERHAHTPSGVAGADLKSQSGGALRTPTLSRFSPPMTCTISLPNLDLPRAGRNSPGTCHRCPKREREEKERRDSYSNSLRVSPGYRKPMMIYGTTTNFYGTMIIQQHIFCEIERLWRHPPDSWR